MGIANSVNAASAARLRELDGRGVVVIVVVIVDLLGVVGVRREG
jgi:hypothetical protein